MSAQDNIAAVEAYINAIGSRDLSTAPLAEEVVFEDPLTERLHGKASVVAFVGNFVTAVNGVKIIRHFTQDDLVATMWEADTLFGLIQIFECFEVSAGQIVSAKAYFDPRPIIG